MAGRSAAAWKPKSVSSCDTCGSWRSRIRYGYLQTPAADCSGPLEPLQGLKLRANFESAAESTVFGFEPREQGCLADDEARPLLDSVLRDQGEQRIVTRAAASDGLHLSVTLLINSSPFGDSTQSIDDDGHCTVNVSPLANPRLPCGSSLQIPLCVPAIPDR